LLFDRKSIKGGKDRVKEKNRPKAREQRVSSGENRTLQGGVLPIEGNKRKRTGKSFLLGDFTYKCFKQPVLIIHNYDLKCA